MAVHTVTCDRCKTVLSLAEAHKLTWEDGQISDVCKPCRDGLTQVIWHYMDNPDVVIEPATPTTIPDTFPPEWNQEK